MDKALDNPAQLEARENENRMAVGTEQEASCSGQTGPSSEANLPSQSRELFKFGLEEGFEELSPNFIHQLHEKESKLVELNTKFSLFRAEAKKQILTVREELSKLQKEFNHQTEELAEKELQLARAQDQHSSIEEHGDITPSVQTLPHNEQLREHYEKKLAELEALHQIEMQNFLSIQSEKDILHWRFSESQREVTLLSSRIALLEKQLNHQVDQSGKILSARLDEIEAQKVVIEKTANIEVEELRRLLAKKNRENQALKDQTLKLRRQVTHLEQERVELEKIRRKGPSSKGDTDSKGSQETYRIRELEMQIERLNTDHKLELSKLQSRTHVIEESLTAERRKVENERQDALRSHANLKKEIEFLKSENQTLRARSDEHEKQKGLWRDERALLEESLKVSDLRVQECLRDVSMFKTQNEEFRLKAEELKILLDKQKEELAQIETAESLLEKQRHQVEIIEQQERRLAAYASSLNRKKQDIAREVEYLLKEYRAAEVAHPLKDYLEFTESELSRTELQLRKTPTVSVDRSRLEKNLQELIQQREFLQSVIKNRNGDLDKRIERLVILLEKSRTELVPPPPPKVEV